MTVSAVIPTYNYGRYVVEAVESVLAQTHAPIEVIVVDDGSTDDTRERLAPFAGRVRYIYQRNAGLCAARNTGIEAARGELIALLDSDDLWAPGKLTAQLAAFARRPDALCVGTGHYSATEPAPASDDTGLIAYNTADLLEYSPFCPSSALIRRSALVEIGSFDIALSGSGDLDMWIRLSAIGPVLQLRAPLTGYRQHGENMSNRADSMLADHQRVLRKTFASMEITSGARRRAEARMHREAAWLRLMAGDRTGAARDIVASVLSWPLAMRDGQGRKRRLQRARLLARACFA